jgi:DNA-binding MarR family transcriptional regulator
MQSADPFVDSLHHWIEVFMHRTMRNFIPYVRESGLSMSQLGALFYLQHKGSTGVTDLGEHLGVTSAAASQMLERLVQQELVMRSEDPIDRRVKQIALTDKGLQAFQDSIRARQSWLIELANKLSTDEKEQITAALNILIDKASQLGQPNEPEC